MTDAELEHGDAADVIWQRLAGRQDPWLLVIDNADDPQVLAGAGTCVAEGRGWLRPVVGQTGMVLVTSRDGSKESWGSWPRRHRLQMLPADRRPRCWLTTPVIIRAWAARRTRGCWRPAAGRAAAGPEDRRIIPG